MRLYFKEGSSQWWTAVQVRDHKYPITSVKYRVSGSGNSYTNLPREPYNYFVKTDGFGVGPYDFRITDFWGQNVEVLAVSLVLTTELDTAPQLPTYTGNGTDPGDKGTDLSGASSGREHTNLKNEQLNQKASLSYKNHL